MSDDNKITLHAFAALVAARAKVSSAEADAYIHQFAKTMSEELEAGGDIHLYHFGRFHTTHVDEQAGHDPNSGVPLTIPAHSRVHFRPYSTLRFAVNAPFRQLRIKELTPDKTGWRTRTGAWILLALLLLLLILLGIRAMSGISTPDASVVPPEMSSDKAVVVHPDQTPDTGAPATVPAAPVEPETTPKAIAAATAVIVSPGDTLWAIAATRLGDPYWWPVIYAENRPELSRQNPDLIDSGITLRIPALAGSVNNPNVADLRLRTSAYQMAADDYRKLGNPRAAEYEKVAARWSKE
ncbi:MAG: HU family DNA-binding protein [Sideroxyarcus sp.]|nr:HU family DNA-binding protein [Sideroxyarcus sp.]